MAQQNCCFLYSLALGTFQESIKSGAWEKETSGRRGSRVRFLPALLCHLIGCSLRLGKLTPIPSCREYLT